MSVVLQSLLTENWILFSFQNGIELEVTITNLRKRKVLLGRSYHTEYSIDVMFFTLAESPEKKQEMDTISTGSDFNSQIDKILENIKYTSKIGEFTSANAIITKKLYHSLKKGDKIEILYLAEDPEKIRAKQLVIVFSNNFGYVLSLIFFLLGLVFLIFSKRKQIFRAMHWKDIWEQRAKDTFTDYLISEGLIIST